MAKKSPKPKDNFTRNLVIAVVVGVLAVMVLPKVLSQNSDVNAAIPANVSKSDSYGVAFNGDIAGIPAVEIWEDFQCPVCAQFEALHGDYIASLIVDKKAKVTYHPLSFIGTESVIAANAAACAADEGKYVQFHNELYKQQSTSENSGKWSTDFMLSFGASLGLQSEKFQACVKNGEYNGWVQNVAQAGASRNVNSTPTVFVNGKEIDRNTQYFNAVEFKKAIEGAK